MTHPRGLLIAALSALWLAAPAATAEAKDAQLSGYDAITRVGHTVKLRTKLETKGFMGINPDVKGEPIDFFVVGVDGKELSDPEFLGTGKTNSDGLATLDWKPDAPGQYELEGRIRRGREYVAVPASILVAVPAPDLAIIIVHLDNTVSTATNLKLFRGTENAKIPAVAGAVETLKTLSTPYQLLYLTDLEHTFSEKFDEWLRLRGVPRAPVLYWELFDNSLSHATYMKKLVAKLHKDLGKASVGIGATQADGEAYVASKLAGIVITDEPDELPASVVPALKWGDVITHIVGIHGSGKLIADMASGDTAKAEAALAKLCLYGRPGIGYVHRFRSSSDPNVASAANLVSCKLMACDAFFRGLTLDTATASLHSLLAAWKYGERSVVAGLYQERGAAKNDPMPAFDTCELVSRNEPEPGKVVFKVRLKRAGDSSEHTLVFVLGEDERWRLAVGDF